MKSPRLGAALAVLVLAACGAPDAQTPAGSPEGATTVQSCGRQVSVTGTPGRVVALDQATTETLLALGVGDRMAGTAGLKTKVAPEYAEAYGKVPVLAPKVLGAETLLAAQPDLVVGSFLSHFTADRTGTREELDALGVPNYVSAVDCAEGADTPFERLFSDYENLGKLLGVEDRAEALADEQRAIVDGVRADRPAGTTVVWVYSVYQGVPYVAGAGGIPSQISSLTGLENAFDDIDEEWPEVSWEEVAQRDPDVIVVGDLSERGNPGDSSAEKLAMMREHPAVSALTAVQQGKVIELPGIEMDPSVRSVNALESFDAALAGLLDG